MWEATTETPLNYFTIIDNALSSKLLEGFPPEGRPVPSGLIRSPVPIRHNKPEILKGELYTQEPSETPPDNLKSSFSAPNPSAADDDSPGFQCTCERHNVMSTVKHTKINCGGELCGHRDEQCHDTSAADKRRWGIIAGFGGGKVLGSHVG